MRSHGSGSRSCSASQSPSRQCTPTSNQSQSARRTSTSSLSNGPSPRRQCTPTSSQNHRPSEPAVRADHDLEPKLEREPEPEREPERERQPEPAVYAEPYPAVHAEPEPSVADAAPSEEEPDRERVVEARQTWRQEWRPASEPSTNGEDTVSSSNGYADATASNGADAAAEEPPAPSGDDRYNDVWATAFREPSSGSADEESHANGSVDAGDPATESDPSPQATAPEPSEEESEAVSAAAEPYHEESETVSTATEASEPTRMTSPDGPRTV